MKWFVTEIKALHPITGEMKIWGGPNVQGISAEQAQQWCNENLGYCKVVGELIAEIPCKEGTYEPDFKNMVDYEKISKQ